MKRLARFLPLAALGLLLAGFDAAPAAAQDNAITTVQWRGDRDRHRGYDHRAYDHRGRDDWRHRGPPPRRHWAPPPRYYRPAPPPYYRPPVYYAPPPPRYYRPPPAAGLYFRF